MTDQMYVGDLKHLVLSPSHCHSVDTWCSLLKNILTSPAAISIQSVSSPLLTLDLVRTGPRVPTPPRGSCETWQLSQFF